MLKNSVFLNFFNRDNILRHNFFYLLNFSATQLNWIEWTVFEIPAAKRNRYPCICMVGYWSERWGWSKVLSQRSDLTTLGQSKDNFWNLEFTSCNLHSKIAKLVFVFPHSKAGEERVFSMVQIKQGRGLCRSGFYHPWFHTYCQNVQ